MKLTIILLLVVFSADGSRTGPGPESRPRPRKHPRRP